MRRRVAALVVGFVTAAIWLAALAPSALAKKKVVCTVDRFGNEHCVVVVTNDPPASSSTTSSNGGPEQCEWTVAQRSVPCQSDQGWWSASLQCYVELAQPQPPQTASVWQGHKTGAIYRCLLPKCPDVSCATQVWLAQPPPGMAATPEQVAQRALASVSLARPTTGRYPTGRLRDGRPFALTRAYTWYWTDPATFTSRTARAAVGGVWAQVTVTPTALTFSPGDGGATVSCAGPGVAWQQGDGVWAPSPAGCDYRYPHSSINEPNQQVTATYGIEWSVTWVGSGGASGTLTVAPTTSTSTFVVAEAEAVVIK